VRLLDVNVLVYAHREDVPSHERYRQWLEGLANGDEAFGLADWVLSGFLRVVTHPKVFQRPTPLSEALSFVEVLRSCENHVGIEPGTRHWGLFIALCKRADARGNLIPDAYLAALALEAGHELITTDRGFARFPGLRWSHPLEGG
jgi:toxin-antitoxin system PIN domain toxin